MSIFSIDGFWKDDHSEFNGYLVTDYDSVPNNWDDDSLFYFGLSEHEIQQSIKNDAEDCLEFRITSYTTIEK